MLTQVLRGDAGGPADPKDAREYVGLNVALGRKTRQPEYIAFYVDPRATQGQGIFVAFAKARRDGVSWKMALDDDGAIRVPFTSCGKLGCMARIPAGLEVEPSTKKRVERCAPEAEVKGCRGGPIEEVRKLRQPWITEPREGPCDGTGRRR
jgi:hypothetical protein